MATINYKENGEWKELVIGGGGGGITVDDAISLTSENPVQNKAITDALDGLFYDYDLLSVTLEQMEAIVNIITSNPMKSKSITCYWGDGMAKVELVYAEDVQSLIAYVGAKKYCYSLLGGTNGWCEIPWVFTPDGNNWFPMLGMANMSSLCNEARIEINGKLHPVVYYEGDASNATLYAVVEDKLNKYVVHGGLLYNPALMTLESSTPIGGTICQLPTGLLDTTEDNPYIFSSEEASALEKAIANMNNTSFVLYEEIQEQFGGTSKRKITFDTSILATFPSDQSLLLLSAQSIAPKQTGSLEINFFPSTLSVMIDKEGESYKGVAIERIIAYQE